MHANRVPRRAVRAFKGDSPATSSCHVMERAAAFTTASRSAAVASDQSRSTCGCAFAAAIVAAAARSAGESMQAVRSGDHLLCSALVVRGMVSGHEARQSHSELCEVKCGQCCSSAPTQGMPGHCEGQGNVGMDEQRGCAWLRREGKGWEVDQADAAKRALAS
ncbi:hypothetical protein HaLaN_01664, partial [Haematococcus lacustris]